MKRRFTILTAALALLVSLAIPMGVWGQTRDTKTDIMFAKGFAGYTTGSFSAAGTDRTAVANSTNATGVTYAMQVFNGSTGAVRGNQSSGAANYSCRNTTTYDGYYISSVSLTITSSGGGTLDGGANGRSIVYFGSTAYANPNTTAPLGTSTAASPNQSGQTTLTWTNTDEDVAYFILYNLKTAGTVLSASASSPLTVVWTKKTGPVIPSTTVTIDDTNLTNTDVYTSTEAGWLIATVKAGTETLSNPSISWVSSNEDVATIDEDGVVTLVAAGTTTITASYAGESGVYGASSATYNLVVTDSTPFAGGVVTFVAGTDTGTSTGQNEDQMTKSGVTVHSTKAALATSEYRLYDGSTTTISTTTGTITEIVFTGNSTSYPVSRLSVNNGNGTYTTNDNNVGTWTGDAVSVSFSADGQARLSQIDVTITVSSGVATTTTINVPQNFNTDIYQGTTAGTLTATVSAESTPISGATVTWSSSNTGVATIDANGAVTLVAVGTTTITASYAGVEDEYLPSSATYELAVTDSAPIGDLVIDFESATTAYTNWTFTNMTSHETSNITAHGGTYYGTTGGKETASITTKSKIATPYTLTCYVSKQSNNTTASTWYIQVSSDGTTWTDVASRSASDMNKGEWKEFTANLSSYTNVYVRVYYSGSTAIRNIDDLTLLTTVPSVIAPTFSPAEGLYTSAQNVTISTTTPGATIYYTLDGTDPTTSSSVYSSPINVSSTTTIKAMAVASGNQSSIVSATYTIELPLSTMDQIFAKATEVGSTPTTVHITLGDWVVTGANTSSHTFVSDGTKGFMIYGSNHGFSAGDVLSGTVECKVQLYNGAAEITQLNSTTTGLTVTTGGTATVANIPMANLSGINTGALVSYQNLTCEARVEGEYTNYYLSDGTTEIQAYKTLLDNYADYLEDGKTYNITGVFVLNNSAKRINPRNAADIEEVHTLTIPGYAAGSAGGYRLIASPVTVRPADIQGMILTGADAVKYDLFYFDQAKDKEWINYKGDASTGNPGGFSLVPGKGYLYAKEATTENQTYTFELTGIPYNNEPIILSKSESGDFPGWNLVGNPFGETAYIGNRSFYVMNEDGSDLMESSGAIAPMKGIFVIAANDGEELQFTKSSTAGKSSRLGLTLSNGRNVIDRATVRFDEGDELPKFQLNKNHTKVYFSMDGEDYAVVRGEEMGAMPVNFKAENNGTYSLSLSSENVELSYLHLIDNMTGADVDLLQTPSYSFEAKTTDYESRFKLVFATGDNSNDDNFAFYSNGSFVINNEGNAELQVIDIMGRIVKSESVNGCTNVNVNAAPGVYMLRLVNGDNVKVQKVVVK